QAAGNVFRGYQTGFQSCIRRDAALSDFAYRLSAKVRGIAGRQVQTIRQPVKDMLSAPDRLRTAAPVHGANATQNQESRFFRLGLGLVNLARVQTPDAHAHPLPTQLFAGEVQKFARFPLPESLRSDDRDTGTHAPLLPFRFGKL